MFNYRKVSPHMLGKTALESLINSNLLIRFRVVILYMSLDYSKFRLNPSFLIFHSEKEKKTNQTYLIFTITKKLVDLDNKYYYKIISLKI